jgi:polar amino acid transport system substrate-binding protein
LLSASSQGKQTLTFGTSHFPPSVIVDPESGHCSGDLIDNVKKIFVESDFRLKIVCAPTSRMYRMLVNGEIDLTATIKTAAQLDGLITLVTPTYADMHLSLFNHKNDKQLKTISAVRGFQYNGQRKILQQKGFEFYDLPDIDSAFQFFIKKRSAYFLAYKSPVIYMLNKDGLHIRHNIVEKKMDSIPLYFAISNKSAMFEQIQKVFHGFAAKNAVKHFLDDDRLNSYLGDSSVTFDPQ